MNRFYRLALALLLSAPATAFGQQTTAQPRPDDVVLVQNPNGRTLGYAPASGIKLLTVTGLAFKDLNKNGTLDAYEDWRLPVATRAKDLAGKLSIGQIAGLMLYSRHQSIPAAGAGYMGGTYNKKSLAESGARPSDLTDQQTEFLRQDNLRHVLITSVQSPDIAARWNNNAQALVEGLGLGIPVNTSTDPRHGTRAEAEFNAGAGGSISMWPGPLGLAATFDPAVVESFGHIAAQEYRALGIATALSPQVDIATDPRWNRANGTFGENPRLATDMAQAYIDGFQTSTGPAELADGWGLQSVNTMVKHWPGGGSGEGGRDAHFGMGKYAVYPGNNFPMHLLPFMNGAFRLKGKTKMASAVMPYYTISVNQDTKNQENVGNAYNKYLINDLLRTKYGFDGVACTDWGVTGDEESLNTFIGGKPWGVEKLTIAERHYKILMAGVDQFGGNNAAGPVLEAYQMGVKEHGEAFMRARLEQSAVRLLTNIFRVGLFENPYLSVEVSKNTVGKAEFMAAGYAAQLKSVVLLKNHARALPLTAGKTVYVSKRFTPASVNFMGRPVPERTEYPVNLDVVKKYFAVTDNPDQADYALVFIASPNSGNGYDPADAKAGVTGYVPISLQYAPYTAALARKTSLGGGDPLETFTNRSYAGKTVKTNNVSDLSMVIETRARMKGKPVIVAVNLSNPMVFSELEKQASAILVQFGVQDQALLDILTGKAEPSALLPMQMPTNMDTVEQQLEDVPQDMTPYTDADGNTYDFGFGLNFSGRISDARTRQYSKKPE
jgi:beta-glucosidase